MKFPAIPVESFEDATLDFETVQNVLTIPSGQALAFLQLFSSQELRIAAGLVVGATGAHTWSTGDFTPSRTGVGAYTLTFKVAPSGSYSAFVTIMDSGAVAATISSSSGSAFTVATFATATGANADKNFAYLVLVPN